MKLFHLSDLHIGKRVNEFSMIEDQKYILTQILYAADQEKPDGILISGDVYDRTIPTAEAVQVFDAFLTRLSEQKIPAFIISGNHDSAERLAFGSSLMGKSGIYFSKVYDRTGDAVICYQGERSAILRMVQTFHYEKVELPTGLVESSGRELNKEYQEKLISKVIYHFGRKWFLPAPIRNAYTAVVSVKYIWKGIRTLAKGKIEVPVLDATAIGVSMFRGDYGTASSVMFLLGVGELLEEWTHK